jgi:hypothetical protein
MEKARPHRKAKDKTKIRVVTYGETKGQHELLCKGSHGIIHEGVRRNRERHGSYS